MSTYPHETQPIRRSAPSPIDTGFGQPSTHRKRPVGTEERIEEVMIQQQAERNSAEVQALVVIAETSRQIKEESDD